MDIRKYHITQPESLATHRRRPCLCGSHDGKRVAFAFLPQFLAAGMVQPEDLCEPCSEIYEQKRIRLEIGPR
jgi:hypothetical protein